MKNNDNFQIFSFFFISYHASIGNFVKGIWIEKKIMASTEGNVTTSEYKRPL